MNTAARNNFVQIHVVPQGRSFCTNVLQLLFEALYLLERHFATILHMSTHCKQNYAFMQCFCWLRTFFK